MGTITNCVCVYRNKGKLIMIQLFIQGNEYCGCLFDPFQLLSEHRSISFGMKWLKLFPLSGPISRSTILKMGPYCIMRQLWASPITDKGSSCPLILNL